MVNFNQNGKKVSKSYSLKHHTSRNKADDSLNLFKVFHQNIRGLKSKADELSTSPFPNYPHIICLTEHHRRDCEINMIPIDRFKLGSEFCRWEYKMEEYAFIFMKILIILPFHRTATVRKKTLRYVL